MKRKRDVLYSTDRAMLETYTRLVKDFGPWLPDILNMRARVAACSGIKGIRAVSWPSNSQACSTDTFKRQYQLETFFKRYIFMDDLHDPESLTQAGFRKFLDSQQGFGIKVRESAILNRVIVGARLECARILGPFQKEVWFENMKFGSKAALDLPLRNSYLDTRMERLSGSKQQVDCFNEYLETDHRLKGLVEKGLESLAPKLQDIDYPRLNITAVPKSYKSVRLIAPDTSIGGFLSLGLGRYIRSRLEAETHIRLASAQDTHKRLAQKASITGHLVTADLSAASDSFVVEHASLLLPEDWFSALSICRVEKVRIPFASGYEDLNLTSLMLMGSGHTFPLQTLLFSCLLKSIADILEITTKCHVFGDDLIYHRRMHRAVCWTFKALGFTINIEKTFATGHFRESCGGDYHRGSEVRPCMIEGIGKMVPPLEYTAFLYNLVNQLTDRWEQWEIEGALAWLFTEICKVTPSILVVRKDAPTYSGLRKLDLDLEGFPVSWPTLYKGGYRYKRLVRDVSRREVVSEGPYLWDRLRSKAQSETEADKLRFETEPEVISLTDGKATVAAKGRQGVRYRCRDSKDYDSVWCGLLYFRHRWQKSSAAWACSPPCSTDSLSEAPGITSQITS